MKRKLISLITSLSLICALFTAPPAAADSSLIPAFPGAEGAGMYATGGRGGTVVHVTNLKDSGSGSFRDAVSGSNRIVVFDVGGTIELKSDVVVKGNVTILGQTAPGGAGVTLKNGKIGMGGDNIIVRFISSRPGEKGSGDYDAWGGSAGSNSIIDHCSLGWANDEQFGLYSKNMNQTVQYCLIGPSDCVSYHSKGAHGFGAMFGKGQNTWHHNMLAHSLSRNFRGKVEKTNSMDFVNNVIYDWGYQTAYGTLGRLNYVNNYLKAGPSTKGGYKFINISSGTAPENYKFYLTGNKMVDKDGSETNNSAMEKINKNNWDGGVNYGNAGLTEADYRSDTPFAVSDVNGNNASYVSKAESAEEAFEHVLTYAGAGISAEKRPKIDRQVMDEARKGTGSLTGGRDFSTVTDSAVKDAIEKYGIKQVNYDEYYPEAILTKEIVDSDNDGMPDEWEIARGLNPNNASDATGDYLGNGYNNIEYYANDLTVNAFPEGVVEVSPTSVDLGPEYEKIKADLDSLTLNPTSIKFPTDLSLPQKGSVNGLDIVWTSSSSAIKISNNQISQVNRGSEAQNVILTAHISYGDYNMSKSFTITVASNSAFWKANSSNNGNSAGTELFDGLTALFDMKYSESSVTINNEAFTGYVSSGANGSLENGVASGTAFKYEASENGYLTAYVTNLGSAENAKILYIVEEGAQSNDDCLSSISGNNTNAMLTARVEAGKTYYVYVAGSKGRFVGIEFSPYAKTAWWKASKTVAAGEELMKNLTPMEELTYSANGKEIDGESFTGAVSGSNNPSENGAAGAALRYIPEADGTLVMYCKVNDTKTAKINDADGNVVASYENNTGTNEYTSLSAELKKGVTYYAYVAGSKAEFYGVSFTETDNSVEWPPQPTDAPPAPSFEYTTLDATEITATSAVLNGNVVKTEYPGSSIVADGLGQFKIWKKGGDEVQTVGFIFITQSRSFSYLIENLEPETTYEYQVVEAENIVEFTTLALSDTTPTPTAKPDNPTSTPTTEPDIPTSTPTTEPDIPTPIPTAEPDIQTPVPTTEPDGSTPTPIPQGFSVELSDRSAVITSPETGTYTVIFAAYDESGALISVEIKNVTFDVGGVQTVESETFNVDGADKVKAALWNTLTDMTPLCPAAETVAP